MTQDELQAKYDRLVTQVKRMRSYQIKYYMYRALQDKANMLRYQREVDKLLSDDVKEKENPQLKML